MKIRVLLSSPAGEMFGLHVIDLDGGECLIGRSTFALINLQNESCSRAHAALCWVGDRVVVTDLGSRNGTYLNGMRILQGILSVGNTLQFGEVRMTVVGIDGSPATETVSEKSTSVVVTQWPDLFACIPELKMQLP